MTAVRLILFDVNETLLDLSALDSHFARAFGEVSARETWFNTLQQLFLTAEVIGKYERFDQLAEAALDMVDRMRQTVLSGSDREEILQAMRHLPAHADVSSALHRLAASGMRMAVLSNSTKQAGTAQLEHAGLAGFFEAILSADDVRHFKPAAAAYDYASRELRLKPEEIRLVAAHGWDVAGALAAGCRAAFVERPKKALNPRGDQPDIIGRTMDDVVAQILARDGATV